MRFPESELKTLKNNTIFEVIFQARFPQILKIEESASEFQEKIRDDYPELEINFVDNLPADMPKEIREAIKRQVNGDHKNYYFFSEDRDWRITLNREFISLSNNGEYKNYKELSEKVGSALEKFHEVYKPNYYSRIGLRYRNVISESILGKNMIEWSEVIPDTVSSEINDKGLRGVVSAFEKVAYYKDEEKKDGMNIIHSFTDVTGKYKGKQLSKEDAYIIDIDSYHYDKIRGLRDVRSKLDEFRRLKNNAFCWSTTERFREQLDK